MLNTKKIATLIAVAVSVSACASSFKPSQNAVKVEAPSSYSASSESEANQLSFFAKSEQLASAAQPTQFQTVESAYKVVDVQVAVPSYLVVSEADMYVPQADIVWREDPLGDRHAQVKAIMENALRHGTAPLVGAREVVMAARVNTFHAVTEKARNTIGGKHNIEFDYVLLDAATQQPITAVQSVDASFKALGGAKAYRAMRKGQTQKVRITSHVANIVTQALSSKNKI